MVRTGRWLQTCAHVVDTCTSVGARVGWRGGRMCGDVRGLAPDSRAVTHLVVAAGILQQIIGRARKRARSGAATLFSTALLAQSTLVSRINLTAPMPTNGWSELWPSANGRQHLP